MEESHGPQQPDYSLEGQWAYYAEYAASLRNAESTQEAIAAFELAHAELQFIDPTDSATALDLGEQLVIRLHSLEQQDNQRPDLRQVA